MRFANRVVRGFLPIALVFVAATWCGAQDQGGQGGRQRRGPTAGGFGMRGFGGMQLERATLLRSEQVLGELKATDEQKEKLTAAQTEYREKGRELMTGLNLREMSQEEREKAMAELRTKRDVLRKATEKQLLAALDKGQVKRLHEIYLQQRGPAVLPEKCFAKPLKLSEEQVAKIKAALKGQEEAQRKLMEEIRGGGREAFAGMREKMQELRKGTETTILAVLTEEQTEQFGKLKGEPFELDRQSLRGGRGQGGGRQGGGRGQGQGQGGGARQRPRADV